MAASKVCLKRVWCFIDGISEARGQSLKRAAVDRKIFEGMRRPVHVFDASRQLRDHFGGHGDGIQ